MNSPIVQSSSATATASHGNASFAQSDSYQLIDAIAADEGRFTSNTDVVINTEIRSIPATKRGVYFAFRDQGACLSLISIKVYHLSCPQLIVNFAKFNSTPTGRDLTSLVAVEGSCVPNSIQIEQPKMFCTADGQWNLMSSGVCKCLPGFEPAQNQTRCQACQPGKFKPLQGEGQCLACPLNSQAPYPGASECKCFEGFYRSARDSRAAPCTQPPSQVTNLTATYIDSTSVILQWSAPLRTGLREDLIYKVTCDLCNELSTVSSPSFYYNFTETKCVISGLQAQTRYSFQVHSMNGVSQQAAYNMPIQFSEISITTSKQTPQTTLNTLPTQNGGFQLLPIFNFRALPGARGTDMILAWDAAGSSAEANKDSGLLDATSVYLQSEVSLYEIKYQARQEQQFRRSPYPASLTEAHLQQQQQPPATQSPQTSTTTNKALAITNLQPKSEYSFQIRAKLANQWTDWSEPIWATTVSQMPPLVAQFQQAGDGLQMYQLPGGEQPDSISLNRFGQVQQQHSQPILTPSSSSNSPSAAWLDRLSLTLFWLLVILALSSPILFLLYHNRNSVFLHSLGFANLGTQASGSSATTYGASPSGFYGSGVFGGGSPVLHHHHQQHHHATMSAGSAGGLISGPNGLHAFNGRGSPNCRPASGGNVVQNFIAATLGQLSGNQQQQAKYHNQQHQLQLHQEKQLFASPASQQLQQRNHYHQTLNNISHQQHSMMLSHQQLASAGGDLFKYRTMSQTGKFNFNLNELRALSVRS